MSRRLELQSILETLLGSGNVYFQQPPNVQMKYPCILYRVSKLNTKFASNKPYISNDQYTITVIDANPDSEIPRKVSELNSSTFSSKFTKDGLNHTIFTVYF